MKKQTGITLIALVITIIVLIILAGISISLLFGDNGIITKAQDAGRIAQEANAKEDIEMAWLSATTDYYLDGLNKTLSEYMTKEKLEKYLPNGSINGSVKDQDDGSKKIKYQTDGKIFTIEVDNAGNVKVTGSSKVPEGITAEMVKDNPETYYGKRVKYSANGIDDWKIFYADEDNIFLITTDYILRSKINTHKTYIVTSGPEGIYCSYWATNPPGAQEVTDSVKSSFMWDNFTNYSTYYNGRCISTMLRTDNWSAFVNSKFADYAIGGPTLEMYTASWNSLYPEEKLYCDRTSNLGYYLGVTSIPNTFSVNGDVMRQKEGFNNTLFYPYPDLEYSEGATFYRLAASSGHSDQYYIIGVGNTGYIGTLTLDNKRGAFRPLVRLKSSTTIETGTDGYDYNLIDNSI